MASPGTPWVLPPPWVEPVRGMVRLSAVVAAVAIGLLFVPDPSTVGPHLISIQFPLLDDPRTAATLQLLVLVAGILLGFGLELLPGRRYWGLWTGAAVTAGGAGFLAATILAAEPVGAGGFLVYVVPFPQSATLIGLGLIVLVISGVVRITAPRAAPVLRTA